MASQITASQPGCSRVAAGVALLGYLIYGLAPLVDAISWLKYLSLFHYYADHDRLVNGVSVVDLAVLGPFAAVLTTVAAVGIARRDLARPTGRIRSHARRDGRPARGP